MDGEGSYEGQRKNHDYKPVRIELPESSSSGCGCCVVILATSLVAGSFGAVCAAVRSSYEKEPARDRTELKIDLSRQNVPVVRNPQRGFAR